VAARLSLARLSEQDPLPGWPEHSWPLLTLLRDLAPQLADIHLDEPATPSQEARLTAVVLAQWQADLARLGGTELAEELISLLTTEPVILIFDGLDEVPVGLRRHVRLAVQAVLHRYPAIERVIITCRIRSYSGPAVLPDFASHTLAPFDEEKIRAFVAAWYQAQARLGRLRAEQVERRLTDLTAAALSDKLRELAENPMLLTTMAMIHQRETELPEERVRLYDEAVKVLLTRWQRRKEIKLSDRLQVFNPKT
jgi:predicted NACHT family NTPase